MSSTAALARPRSDPPGGPGPSDHEGRSGESAREPEHEEERRALLLLLGTPEDVLARIVPGDPLGIGRRVARELRRGALLLDLELVTRRAFARCARAAALWRGDPPLERWLEERVREALEDLRRHDRHVRGSGDPAEPGLDAFESLAPPLGLRARPLREACARFNRLAQHEREAFFSILIDGRPLDSAARRAGVALSEAARRARRALELFRLASGDADSAADGAGGAVELDGDRARTHSPFEAGETGETGEAGEP